MLKINNVEYRYLQGHHLKKSLTSELWSRTFTVFSETIPNFKLFDIAEYNNEKYFVASKNVVGTGKTYQTITTLVELTYILEKYILSPCSFTNMNDTLKDQIEKLFYKVEPLRVGETPRFKFTTRLINLLGSTPGEDFKYTERMTLRDILDDMLAPLGVRCVVSSLTMDLSEIYIDYLDLNYKSQEIMNLDVDVNYKTNESTEYYSNELDVLVKNTLSRKNKEVVQDWQTLKPIEAGTDSLMLSLDNPIEEIISCYIKLPVTIEYTEYPGGPVKTSSNVVLSTDISELIIEDEIYNALDIEEKEKHIPYKRGSKAIGLLETYKVWFFPISKLGSYLRIALRPSANEWLKDNIGPDASVVDISNIITSNTQETALFRVKYTPYIDVHFRHSKDIDNSNKKISTFYNQTDRNVNLDKFSKSIRALANRTGNPIMTREVNLKAENQLLELGTRIANDYSLISIEAVIFDSFLKCTYIFYQNYQADTTVRLAREKRLFNTPRDELVERDIIIKDSLLLSTQSLSVFNDSSLATNTLEVIVKSFEDNPGNDSMDKILFKTVDKDSTTYPSTNYDFALNLFSLSLGKSLIFQTQTYDNYSVGLSTNTRLWRNKVVFLNPYCDDEGECETINFRFVKTNIESLSDSEQLEVGKSLPILQVGLYPSVIEKTYSNQTIGYNYIVKKDRLEILKFIYQLEAKALSDDIIIGNHLMDFVSLLQNKDNTQLCIWINPIETYSINETDKCKGVIPPVYMNVNVDPGPVVYRIYTDYPVELLESWAIGTTDGRLLIAVNNKKYPLNSIYFGLSRNK